ncbi:unnamed protein product [Toxocara canis]|uniref:glucuronosyltransferase n=1 Tax=Toxocara canis TaxID=6265 RepID=A0A183UYJ3_TOXCA|nr:unnamed protein product [Toxocara canis]
MANMKSCLCVLFLAVLTQTYARQMKFLFYSPSWGHSHLHFQGALVDALVDEGHIAHVLIPEFHPNLKTNGTVKAHRVVRIAPSVPSLYPQMSFNEDSFAAKSGSISLSREYEIILNVTLQFCEDFLNQKDLIKQLQTERYDVGFTEFFDYCPVGILHHIGVNSIALLSAVPITDLLADTWGLPSPSSYVTNTFKPFIGAPYLSMSERFMNFVFTFVSRKISFAKILNEQNSMFKRMIRADFPDLRLLAQNASIAFINIPQIIDIPRPISNKIVHIGGIAMKKSSSLSMDLSAILDRPNSRVVLFSLGSIVKLKKMPHEMRSAFLEAFARFPEYDFIVKVDMDLAEGAKLLDDQPNVHAFKWIDQVNILRIMPLKLLLILVLTYSSIACAKQLKFLFYSPNWGHSHLQFQGVLADILVDSNHIAQSVNSISFQHVLIPEYDPNLKTNGTLKAQRVIRIPPSVPSQYPQFSFNKHPFMKNNSDLNPKEMEVFKNMTLQFCEDILNQKDLIEQLRSEHYDVGFTEFFEHCSVGLFHHVGVKSTAFVSATVITDLLAHTWGLPAPASYVTNVFRSFINAPELTIWQRLQNFLHLTIVRKIFYPKILDAQNALFKRLVSADYPDLEMLARNAAIAFINTPQIVDIPKPISSKIIYIGGIAMRKPSTLSKEFSVILDRPNSRVVLFSFGSITQTKRMPMKMKIAFLEAFTHFPNYEFIVKIDSDDSEYSKLTTKYRNVHAFNWVDQINILQHPSTKAFITHSGLNSIIEALYSGTPLVCIPLFADQTYNAVIAIRKNVAVYVDTDAIATDVIVDALDKVLNDPKYAENSRILREKLEKYPLDSKELFIKWSEYLAEFGDFTDLNLYGAEMGFFTYYLLDIFFAIFIGTICLAFITFKIIVLIWRKFQMLRKMKIE